MKKENTDKLTDKAFLRLVVTSVLAIAVCLICLCSTTWAWFSEDVSSHNNALRAGSCTLTVAVADDGMVVKDVDQEKVTLEAGVVYTVTLTLPVDSASGYCVVVADGNKYRSQYLTANYTEQPKISTFYVEVQSEQEVSFFTHWGIYSGECDVRNGDTLVIE